MVQEHLRGIPFDTSNEEEFETLVKNHQGFLIHLELIRPQFIPARRSPRRMWGPLIDENKKVGVIWYADALSNIRLVGQDRKWMVNHPVPFERRHAIPNTEDFSGDEIALLDSEYPFVLSQDPQAVTDFFQQYKDNSQFKRSFASLVEKACQEVDRLLT